MKVTAFRSKPFRRTITTKTILIQVVPQIQMALQIMKTETTRTPIPKIIIRKNRERKQQIKGPIMQARPKEKGVSVTQTKCKTKREDQAPLMSRFNKYLKFETKGRRR